MQERANPLRDKSYAFALHIVAFCTELRKERKEFVLADQLLKSGTSIGANIEEALQGQSRADFISKLSIALKEAHETRYWLKLIHDSAIDVSKKTDVLCSDAEECIRLLTSIIKSTKSA